MSVSESLLEQEIAEQPKAKPWAYVDTGSTRDLRLDFMRGIVIPLLFASHFEYFSALMYIGWERVGVVSTAEIFVILAGIVLMSQAFLLRIGPHQFQIIGMYVAMFILVTPFVFFMISRQRVGLLLGISWVIYFNFGAHEPNNGSPAFRPTGAQFEYAFPILAWQLIYVHGVVAGYFKKEIVEFFSTTSLGKILLYVSFALTAAFFVLTWNNPMTQFSDISLRMITPETFHSWYGQYFQKYKLGPGRVLNVVVLLITMYAILSRCWKPINKALGWFFIPLGQASLYVFYVHIFFLLIIANTPLPEMKDFWINTMIHAALLFTIWAMVRTKFLFKVIPN